MLRQHRPHRSHGPGASTDRGQRVLGLVKAFLKAGVLTETGAERDTRAGTPQGGILSPLLANVALSVLDDHFAAAWQSFGGSPAARYRRRLRGLPTYRLVRYADDFVVMVKGTREHAEALRTETAEVLASMGLRLSGDKTRISHIDKGFDFLGWRIQRQTKRGTSQRYIYTYPSRKALQAIKTKVKALTKGATDQPLAVLLYRLNPVLRGWATYFRAGVSSRTFSYLGDYAWRRVILWLRRKHPRSSWKQLRRRYLPRWRPTEGNTTLFNPATVATERYRYRGHDIATPWTPATITNT